MIRRIVNIVILVPVAIVLIVLSVANRQSVTLALNPFNPDDTVLSVSAPFFVFLFATLMVGMVIGSLATWVKQGKYRSSARSNRREAVRWHKEADQLKSDTRLTTGLPTTTR